MILSLNFYKIAAAVAAVAVSSLAVVISSSRDSLQLQRPLLLLDHACRDRLLEIEYKKPRI